jgi:flagellar biosynthesis/type III secretory pathway protein FliH
MPTIAESLIQQGYALGREEGIKLGLADFVQILENLLQQPQTPLEVLVSKDRSELQGMIEKLSIQVAHRGL